VVHEKNLNLGLEGADSINTIPYMGAIVILMSLEVGACICPCISQLQKLCFEVSVLRFQLLSCRICCD